MKKLLTSRMVMLMLVMMTSIVVGVMFVIHFNATAAVTTPDNKIVPPQKYPFDLSASLEERDRAVANLKKIGRKDK